MNDHYNDRTRLSTNIQTSSSLTRTNNFRQTTNSHYPETSSNNIEENLPSLELRPGCSPLVCLFTFLFKVLGIICYLCLGTITKDSALIFILVILLAAVDFWTVKNITGRFIVGLRWGNEVQEDGTEKWYFAHGSQEEIANTNQKQLFWWSQAMACIFWGFNVLLNILRLTLYWGGCSFVCLILNIINFWGYYRCYNHANDLELPF